MTKSRPIVFTGESVRAIMAGQKTQTRRVIKQQPQPQPERMTLFTENIWTPESNSGKCFINETWRPLKCKYGEIGDLLWVRETWAAERQYDRCIPSNVNINHSVIWYKATPDSWAWGEGDTRLAKDYKRGRTRQSIFMPRFASRLALRITDIRPERLQDISDDDAIAEGAWKVDGDLPSDRFARTWDSINAKRGYSWHSNPWVWAISFEVHDK